MFFEISHFRVQEILVKSYAFIAIQNWSGIQKISYEAAKIIVYTDYWRGHCSTSLSLNTSVQNVCSCHGIYQIILIDLFSFRLLLYINNYLHSYKSI